MFTVTVDIPLNDHGLRIIEQQLTRCSAKELQCRRNPVASGSGVLAGIEFDESRPTPTQGNNEGEQRVMIQSDDGEIDLHLNARLGLKACNGVVNRLLHGIEESSEHAIAASVSTLEYLLEQNASRYPVRTCRGNTFKDVGLEGVELAGSGCPGLIVYIGSILWAANIASHGLAGT